MPLTGPVRRFAAVVAGEFFDTMALGDQQAIPSGLGQVPAGSDAPMLRTLPPGP
jgi:hypothetical protein